ncbi:hypothetical protein AHAS_Ahas09G0085800 [Arachis hypogaea]
MYEEFEHHEFEGVGLDFENDDESDDYVSHEDVKMSDLDIIRASEYLEGLNIDHFIVNDDELVFSEMFVNKEVVIARLKAYSIKRSVRNYNGPHSCIQSRLSQDHSKLDSGIMAAYVKPVITADLSMKVKLVITEIQNHFNYTPTYRKA